MTANPDSLQNLHHWLALYRAPGLGAATFRTLRAAFADPAVIASTPGAQLESLGLSTTALAGLRQPDWSGAEADLRWLEADDHHLLALGEPDYPALLAEIPDPPPLLFVHGDPRALSLPQLALVGSRNPTSTGQRAAHDFAAHLAGAGLAITSGLALGVDGAAHQGALDAGGITLAVMGTGPDRIYPARHRDLAHAIVERGALVTEFPLGTPPLPDHFPRRNRLISGLSLGTLVVEAALRSGSLITARFALEQGREVFAIPGSIHNPLARGCHALIRQGAKLVETAQDIAEELGALSGACATGPGTQDSREAPEELSEEYRQLLDSMGYDPVSVDELVSRCGLTAKALSSMLLLLELQDYVASSAGGRYVRTEKRA
jgi:DNA processing protein